MHIYTSIFGYKVPTYGLLIVAGILVANAVALLCIKKKYKSDSLEDFLILEAYTLLGAFLGAKILYLIVSYKDIEWSEIWSPPYFNKVMQGGFVFYGGLTGGLLFLFLGAKIHKLSAYDYLRHYIFLIPLIHSFGRIGCYEAGCCYGVPYSGPGAVIFPENSFAPSEISLLPIQLIEAVFLVILAGAILFLQIYRSWKYTVEIYLASYGILRFILEFYRFDEKRGSVGVLSVSQWISLFFIVIAFFLLKKNEQREIRERN